jgi:hypothetical protein
MPRKRRLKFIPADPKSPAPPLPRQHQLEVQRANDLIARRQPLVRQLRCSWCPGSAPMPKLALYSFPPAHGDVTARTN